MPDIEGTSRIVLQPTERVVPYTFTFPVCSSATANDGAIPYGDSVSACTLKAYDSDGNDVSSELVSSSSVASNVVTVELDYPSTSGAGKYKLTFQITTANSVHLEFDFNRVVAIVD
jgi:hypothetical protein